MPREVLRGLLAGAVPIELRAREALFHAGDDGTGCYYLRQGAAKAAVIAKDGQERLLAVLGPGSLIGELSLFDDLPRSATVSALRPCKLLHMPKASFFQLADRNPQIYRQALRLLTQRLRGTNDQVVAQGTVTVLGRVARAFQSLAEGIGESATGGRIVFAGEHTSLRWQGYMNGAVESGHRAAHDVRATHLMGH
mgnify:CR=1 FL=1